MSVNAGTTKPLVVRGELGLRSLQTSLLSGRRKRPMIGLTRSLNTDEPVLVPSDVRGVVGVGPPIYYILEEYLRGVREALGPGLALPAGAARIWWPGLSRGSDPGEHPLVLELNGEPERNMLVEFARQFDLSRPRVREEIRLIEDLQRLAEAQLAQAVEQNHGMKIERHEALTRAEKAEARLKIATERLRELGHRDDPESV